MMVAHGYQYVTQSYVGETWFYSPESGHRMLAAQTNHRMIGQIDTAWVITWFGPQADHVTIAWFDDAATARMYFLLGYTPTL